jgi:hypothetical protein
MNFFRIGRPIRLKKALYCYNKLVGIKLSSFESGVPPLSKNLNLILKSSCRFLWGWLCVFPNSIPSTIPNTIRNSMDLECGATSDVDPGNLKSSLDEGGHVSRHSSATTTSEVTDFEKRHIHLPYLPPNTLGLSEPSNGM